MKALLSNELAPEDIVKHKKALGLEHTTNLTEKIIKQAYKRKSFSAHPDKGGSETAFKALNEAKEELIRDHKRLLTKSGQISQEYSYSNELEWLLLASAYYKTESSHGQHNEGQSTKYWGVFFENLRDSIFEIQKKRDEEKKPNGDWQGFKEENKSDLDEELEGLAKVLAKYKIVINSTDAQQIEEIIRGAYENTRFTRWLIALIQISIATPILLLRSACNGRIIRESQTLLNHWFKGVFYVMSRAIVHAPYILSCKALHMIAKKFLAFLKAELYEIFRKSKKHPFITACITATILLVIYAIIYANINSALQLLVVFTYQARSILVIPLKVLGRESLTIAKNLTWKDTMKFTATTLLIATSVSCNLPASLVIAGSIALFCLVPWGNKQSSSTCSGKNDPTASNSWKGAATKKQTCQTNTYSPEEYTAVFKDGCIYLQKNTQSL